MADFLDEISSFSPKRLALLAAKLKERLDHVEAAACEPIAVIGLGCRFPGSDSPDSYWSLLSDGRDVTREVPADRWPIDQYFDPNPDTPGKMSTRRGGFLDQIDGFDPHFFGIAPREALVMDPQQRLLLEVSWEALENAGIDPDSLAGSRTGVFIGVCNYDYHQLLLTRDSAALDAYVATGNAHSVISGRVAYLLGLQGPALSIDTACSSSLVAIHTACQSLRTGETKLALAGGVNIICSPDTTISISRGHMLAPDGRCKTFDAAADGFSRSEGCGMVLLKRLSDARRDGNRILALVRGSAVNQDGRSGGLTVPNGPAQEAVIRDALAMAGLNGAEINYVEAHGTGTSLGDPIEVRALARALGGGRGPAHPLLIGSVKTNIGHLESAAGVAGFIKVVLALQHEEIPPHLNFKTPNPHIEWADLPVAVTDERQAWWRDARPRRAGVSAFGFSGTNSHVILEEAPAGTEPTRGLDRPLHCLTLSARGESPLRELARRYAKALAPEKGIHLSDAAFTAATGRAHLPERVALIVANEAEARAALTTIANGGSGANIRRGSIAPGAETDVVFLYTGAGAQYPGMGQALYETSPVYREAIDRCDALLGPDLRGLTLKSVLQASAADDAPIHDIAWTQPALFAVEYALTQLWRSWGIEPAAVIGHSVGEYAAACAAGVFTLEDGLKLIAERGRLMASLPPGGMMAAVFAPADDILAAIAPMSDRVAVAAINSPGSVVISGETAAVEAALASFETRNIMGQRLYVSLAAHSPLVDPALDSMEALARTVQMSPPKIPVAWNLTGATGPVGMAPDPLYWRRHMREPVRFADGIKGLYDAGYRNFLEVGPHPTLIALAQQALPGPGTHFYVSLRRGKEDWSELLTSLADLHVKGVPVDWFGVDRPYGRRPIALPTYPFERTRYWAAPAPQADRRQLPSKNEATDIIAAGADTIFYKIEWEPARASPSRLCVPSRLREGVGDQFDRLAKEHGFSVYDRLMPELDRLSAEYAASALVELGFDASVGRCFSASEEAARLGVANRHRRLFGQLVDMLAEHGVLKKSGDTYIVARVATGFDPSLKTSELLRKFNEVDSEIRLLSRCGAELARVLRGEQDPLPLLFMGDSFADVKKIYCDSPYSRTYNGLLSHLVQRATAQWGEDRPLRVLEIGAGTGGTTRYVLPLLAAKTEYTFTDVSPLFLAQAGEQFRDYPLHTALLDIERDPADQGFEIGSYDIVIAANVLHATADLRQTMTHVGRLLAPGGMLFVAEGLSPERWVNLTFGLTEGWWRFTDLNRRTTGPLLDRDGWQDLLSEVGFADVLIAPERGRAEGCASHQALITAIWPGAAAAHRWIVLADESDIAERLKSHVTTAGDEVIVVPRQTWLPAFDSVATLQGQPWWPATEPLSGPNTTINIVYLGALDSSEEADGLDFASRLALVLLQSATAVPAGKVWLITRGALDVRGPSDVVAPDQAGLWGLGRTFAREHPSQWGGLIDLDPIGDTTNAVASLVDSIRADDGEDQVALREGSRRVARLIPAQPPAIGTISIKPDRSYLVTGGLGGIGLEVSAWLAARGARHLVIFARTPIPPRQEWIRYPNDLRIEAVKKLEDAGVTVNTVTVDVGDPSAMAHAMAKFGNEWPPLGGIIHAAVGLTKSPLANMSRKDFEAMFRTKVGGARLLDALSVSQPVEFCVYFSTTAALFGQVEFAHYAASNAVLDALACSRAGEGRPTLSVNWGTWQQMRGLKEEDRSRLARSGMRQMPAAVALAALESLIAEGVTRAVVADVNWPVLRSVYESRRAQPLLSHMKAAERSISIVPTNGAQSPTGPAIDFESLTPAERREAIEVSVRREVAQVIGLHAPDSINLDVNLFKMGLDSLMAIELRGRLERVVAATLPPSLAFNHPTVRALIEFLDVIVAARVPIPDDSKNASELLARLPNMSGEEVDSLLASMLAEEERL